MERITTMPSKAIKATCLPKLAKATPHIPVIGVFAPCDPRVDAASRSRAQNIASMVADTICGQVVLPDKQPVSVVYSDVLVDGEAQADIVARHTRGARDAGTSIPEGVSPHSFRHQKAIDLLESGINLVYIRDLLGHRSVTTTEIYATVSLARKRALLEQAATAPKPHDYPDWSEDRDLVSWLKSLC